MNFDDRFQKLGDAKLTVDKVVSRSSQSWADFLENGPRSTSLTKAETGVPLLIQSEPLFENMPDELKQLDRWVCWSSDKTPWSPNGNTRKANVNDPKTFGPFESARARYLSGGYQGVGFVLGESRIAAVDMDDCVESGVPRPEALELMLEIGCQYVEFSPSGNGLRGFGFADRVKGTRGEVQGVSVELYTQQRYMTVTGNIIWAGPIVELQGFAYVAKRARSMKSNTRGEHIESVSSNTLVSSVSSVTSVSSVGIRDFPGQCFPKKFGQRNKCIFEVARFLKGVLPGAEPEQFDELLCEWHQLVFENIETKEFDVSWSDFRTAWSAVLYPYGEEISKALLFLPEVPSWINDARLKPYGARGRLLIQICWALQCHCGDEPFFLSSRKAEELIGMHFTDAAKMLKAFVADGFLTVVSKGSGHRASRYLMKDPHA